MPIARFPRKNSRRSPRTSTPRLRSSSPGSATSTSISTPGGRRRPPEDYHDTQILPLLAQLRRCSRKSARASAAAIVTFLRELLTHFVLPLMLALAGAG